MAKKRKTKKRGKKKAVRQSAPKRLSEGDFANRIKAWLTSTSDGEAAKKVSVSKAAFAQWRMAHKLPRREPPKRYTERVAVMLALMPAQVKTLRKIAARTGSMSSAVRDLIEKSLNGRG